MKWRAVKKGIVNLGHVIGGGEGALERAATMNPSALGADVDACFAHFTRRVADLALHSEANRNRFPPSPEGISPRIDSRKFRIQGLAGQADGGIQAGLFSGTGHWKHRG